MQTLLALYRDWADDRATIRICVARLGWVGRLNTGQTARIPNICVCINEGT